VKTITVVLLLFNFMKMAVHQTFMRSISDYSKT